MMSLLASESAHAPMQSSMKAMWSWYCRNITLNMLYLQHDWRSEILPAIYDHRILVTKISVTSTEPAMTPTNFPWNQLLCRLPDTK